MTNKSGFIKWVLFVGLLLPGTGAWADEAGKHLFILSGQSNMTRPLAESFRSCVEQVYGGDRVIVVRYGKPSQPIKRWYKGWQPPAGMTDEKPEDNGGLYDEMMGVVRRSLKDQAMASTTFIWMQGEADSRSWASVYEKSFLGVIEQLKADLGVKHVNFVVGRINDYWLMDKEKFPDAKLVREVQQSLGENHAHGDWIDTDDLNRGVNPWGGYSFEDGHFPPSGYRVMGQRFAKKACLLLDPTIELDPAIFEERFIDSTDAIETHIGVGKAVTINTNVNADLSILTDGMFGKADPEDAAWAAIDPSETPVELVIDLGEPISVESIAISTLLSSSAKAEFPKKIVYSTSLDGKAFQINNNRYNSIHFYNGKQLSAMRNAGIKPTPILLLTDQRTRTGPVTARYVKVTIETADQRVLIDEVVVNPNQPSEP